MPSNPLNRFIAAPLPPIALSLSETSASVVELARRRGVYTMPRAGTVGLPHEALRPNFDETNIHEVDELIAVLTELINSTGLNRQKRWSVALPEAATRTAILTLESAPASRSERDEMLQWKIERAFGSRAEDLRVSHERLAADERGRTRFLAAGARRETLAEYEALFAGMNLQAGLILPAHLGEARWLMSDVGSKTVMHPDAPDALLVSSHKQGFTAMILRGGIPLIVRSIVCDEEARADEFYRLMLFYRDRLTHATKPDIVHDKAHHEPHHETPDDRQGDIVHSEAHDESYTDAPAGNLHQIFITGDALNEAQARDIIHETLATDPHTLRPEDVRLALPATDLTFTDIAAAAGLASMAWR
ncbi:MAG: hypothetical protein MSG64_16460 [Pyrinomonadaceae bacterium MAG19_C2-C3]|nr:hypothetical protein [Pyrinomonadaceae bacterium MAG19_C2-C3]